MLSNPEMFAAMESSCRERGVIERFEAENGEKVKGRMMIDIVDMPDDIPLTLNTNERITAFEASFDFMDTRIGFAFCIPKMEAASNFWYNGVQRDNLPDDINVWLNFFVQTLLESIAPDGSHGVPIYTFISDHASFSCVPTAPDELLK